MCKSIKTIIVLLLFASGSTSWTMPGLLEDGSLNREEIQKLYFDGEFEPVAAALEQFRKINPQASEEDRIFMYKYLSVVYAANSETRDKAESYMYQLLKLVPAVDLMDMYISDSIKAIFNKVKTEYQARNQPAAPKEQKKQSDPVVVKKPDPAPAPQAPAEKEADKPEPNRRWIWWTAGGLAVAGAVTAFVLLSGDEEPDPNDSFTNY
ncbi:hypothetical protein ACFL5V_11415 [Fibrobacterota bacterium]